MAKRNTKKVNVTQALTEQAPRKRAAKKSAPGAVSTHKARAAWFNAREAWPLREAPLELVMRERTRAAVNMPLLSAGAEWEDAGPTNIGGRTTSIVVHPTDVRRIWIGAAGGGVWTSTDGGLNWTALWHSEPTLNIGSLCLDPSNPDTIYCGTGEANLSADSHPGVGLYRSLDGGETWCLLAPAFCQGLPKRIGRVAVDPFDSNHILLGGVGHGPQDSQGLFVSHDGGINWTRVTTIIDVSHRCHEVVFHPTESGTIYVTIDALGSLNGIWRTTDGGRTWTHLTSGLPLSPVIRRTSLAIAPSDPAILYAQMATSRGGVLGVFRSANGGDNWNDISGNHFNRERQMNYNNTISVNPADADDVICGGVDLHRTKNGGNTWSKVTAWNARRGERKYAHADQHFVVHPPGQNGLVYAVNDGGLDVSEDGGRKWQNRSNGLATNMFYDLSVAASHGGMYGGGMQDNGTWLTLDGGPGQFIETTGGDGGFCAIDPNDRFHLFTSSQFMRVNRFRNSDGWSVDIGPNDGSPPWMAFIAMDPKRPKRVFVCSVRVWRSLDDGDTWTDVSGSLDDSFISCIEISRANTNRIYAGTENGGIFRSDDGGKTWTGNIASSVLPGRTVTRLRTPADDADVVYATVANFGNSHLFRSSDGGNTWHDVDGGGLPDVPHHGIVIPASDSDRIYVGNDAGVFVSLDRATTWQNLTLNLPTVMVVDLVLHEATQTLFAATYGRSTWKLDVSQLP